MHRFVGTLPCQIWPCWHGIVKICLFSCQLMLSEVSWLKYIWIQTDPQALHPCCGFYNIYSLLITYIPKIFNGETSVLLWGSYDKHLLGGMSLSKPGHICLPCYGLYSLALFMNKSYRVDKLVTMTACFVLGLKHKFIHLYSFSFRNLKIYVLGRR